MAFKMHSVTAVSCSRSRDHKSQRLPTMRKRLSKPWFPLAPTANVVRSAMRVIIWAVLLIFSLIITSNYCELEAGRRTQPLPFSCRCQTPRPQIFAEPQGFHALSNEKSVTGRACSMAYSAFYDHRDHAIKVVTDSDLSCFRSVSVTCQLWYANMSRPFLSHLKFDYHLLENEKTEAAERLGAIYSCNASSNTTELPYAVSFYSQRDVCKCHPTLSMEIHYPRKPTQKFVACVPALYGRVSMEEVVGFVELHRLLGAEKFYFYEDAVSAEVKRTLEKYSRRGLAEVLRWQPPFPSRQIYHDQQVMQLDCSMRNLRQSEWVAQMDVDEALLPTDGHTWSQMINSLGHDNTGAFVFLNRFFAKKESALCPNTRRGNGEIFSFDRGRQWFSASDRGVPVYLRYLSYYDEDFPAGSRSKIMYRPEATAQARTHMALLRHGFDLTVLNYSQAANFHYRHEPMVGTAQTRLDHSACFHDAALMRNVRQMVAAVSSLENE